MENRFDMGDFEQSLKDHADQFRMVPSKRVWNGIYNNLHPGSRWPSVTVAVILMIMLVTIGNLNNSPQFFLSDHSVSGKTPSVTPTGSTENNSGQNKMASTPVKPNEQIAYIAAKDLAGTHTSAATATSSQSNTKEENVSHIEKSLLQTMVKNTQGQVTNTNIESRNESIMLSGSGLPGNDNAPVKNADEQQLNKSNAVENNVAKTGITEYTSASNSYSGEIAHAGDLYNSEYIPAVRNENFMQNILSPLPKPQPVSYVFTKNNTPALDLDNNVEAKKDNSLPQVKKAELPKKKKNSKIEWEYYLTPSIGSAIFRGETLHPNTDPTQSSSMLMPDIYSRDRAYSTRLNFESGIQINFKFRKKWAFFTGADLSYSGYKALAYPVHPTAATLVFRDESSGVSYSKMYVASYGNGIVRNQKPLNNYSLQASIPLGLEYMIWNNKDMQVNILSSIAPTAVLKSNAYLLSYDGKYYVQDPSLLRKWNVTGTFAPFISFTSHKVKWKLGPQIRYQFLSSYKNNYTVKEHLVDYGIKIGISK
jgi:hypothetical protein